MKLWATIPTMLSLLAAPVNAAPDRPCLSESEMEDVLLILAPVALQIMGDTCAKELPHGSVLRNPESDMAKNLAVASDEAWSRARKALVRLMISEGGGPIKEDLSITKETFTSLLAPQLGKIITKPESCAPADRMLKLAEPLPPRNLAGMIVQVMVIMPRRKDVDVLCPAAK